MHARLKEAKDGLEEPPEVINADGVKFAAMKVSSISGDARRVLDICRYVSGLTYRVNITELRCRRAVELVHPRRRAARTPGLQLARADYARIPAKMYKAGRY